MKIELTRPAAAAETVAQQPDCGPSGAPATDGLPGPALKIPPILFENDDPAPVPRPAAPAAPSAPAPATGSAVGPPELPVAYGTEALLLTAREPHCLYAHWDLTDDQQTRYRSRAVNGCLVVRIGQEPPAGPSVFEVPVLPEARHRFIEVPAAGTHYAGTLGFYEADGGWATIAASGPVWTPAESPSADRTVRFATLAPLPEEAPPPAPPPPTLPILPSPAEPLPGQRATSGPSAKPAARPPTARREGGTALLEPSQLPPSPPPDRSLLMLWEADPPTGGEAAVPLDFSLASAPSGSMDQWTTAQENALAEMTPLPARLGEGNSADLLG